MAKPVGSARGKKQTLTRVVAVPVNAATVVLVRQPADEPWQCYMVKRHTGSNFAAGVYVFPGGKVDPEDAGAEVVEVVHGLEVLAQSERAVVVAAFRELLEEAGVLPARTAQGTPVVLSENDRIGLDRARRAMQTGSLGLVNLLLDRSWHLKAADLVPLSRWITPVTLPRRFDTRFFLCWCPPDQVATHDEQETTDGRWIAPEEALAEFSAGTFPLVFATQKHLERLARYETVEALVESIRAQDLEPVTPQIVGDGPAQRILLPGDRSYVLTRE